MEEIHAFLEAERRICRQAPIDSKIGLGSLADRDPIRNLAEEVIRWRASEPAS
jgi:hypothetical protein